jgi:SAM-dependent methyltransferase
MNDNSRPQTLTHVIERLGRCPELLATLKALMIWLDGKPEYSVALGGSVATAEADAFSDLDLVIVVDGALSLEEEQQKIVRSICDTGRVLASFRATHLGMPNLFVTYLEVGRWVVKVDAEIVASSDPRPLSTEAIVIHGPASRFRPLERGPAQALDFASIQQKFCGWLWYTYTKIQRGELFQAARSIDYTREHALLPCLLFIHGLPQDGHRRVEERLPAKDLERLARTYPAQLERRELMRAFRELSEFYAALEPELAQRFPDVPRSADVEAMAAIIARHSHELDTPGDAQLAGSAPSAETPWYERFYRDDYSTLVRKLLTPERTEAEVRFILEVTGLAPPAAIADVACGEGRHARLLAGRGFSVTGVDLNPEYIRRGRELAGPEPKLNLHVGDMREAIGGPYDLVLSLFNSFGFLSDADNELVIARWSARLRPGGAFLLELWNRDALVRRFEPRRARQVSPELEMEDVSQFDPVSGRLQKDYAFRYTDGRTAQYRTDFRLYAASEIRALLERCGLRVEAVHGSLARVPYSWDAERLVVLARKPEARHEP